MMTELSFLGGLYFKSIIFIAGLDILYDNNSQN